MVRRTAKYVLVADDDEGVRDVLRLGLASLLDVVIVEAENGEQALRLAAELIPDVVILDIDMPLVNGLEVARRLRANPQTREIPILAFSGIERRQLALDAGCDEFLLKPASLSRVAEWVRGHTERRLRERVYLYQIIRYPAIIGSPSSEREVTAVAKR